jgi:hypothetical protein
MQLVIQLFRPHLSLRLNNAIEPSLVTPLDLPQRIAQ